MNFLMLWFFKITVWPLILLFYRPKIRMYDKNVKRPKVKGTIIISNHYSVYDFPLIFFAFFFRTIYFISGEILYKKRFLGWWITSIGAIRTERDQKDIDWIFQSEKLLKKGRTILVFPQGKISANNDEPFKQAFAVLASQSKAKILSVYVNGNYSFKNRGQMIIGKKIDINTLWSTEKDSRENIKDITTYFQNYNKELQAIYDSRQVKKQR